MADENATHKRRVVSLKEHLAGVKAGQVWSQEVVANHLQHLSSVYDAAKQSTEVTDGETGAATTAPS